MEVADQPFDAESVGDSEDADLVPIQSGEDWVTCPDRPLGLGRSFVSVPYSSRIPRASRCWNGSGLMFFLPGRKLGAYARKYGFCGTP